MRRVPGSRRVSPSQLKQQHSAGSGSTSAAGRGTRPSPQPPRRRHASLSALYLPHQREKPRAQTQCAPPQSRAGGRGRASQRPRGRLSGSNAKSLSYLANSGFSEHLTPWTPAPLFSGSKAQVRNHLYSAALRQCIPMRGNMVQCTHSPRRLYENFANFRQPRGQGRLHFLFPHQTVNLNKPACTFKHSPITPARTRQAHTCEGRRRGRLAFPQRAARSFPDDPGCSVSFTVEWFSHCEREVVASPPAPLSSLPTPPPRQASTGNGSDVCGMENSAASLPGPGKLAFLPPPSVPSSDPPAPAAEEP